MKHTVRSLLRKIRGSEKTIANVKKAAGHYAHVAKEKASTPMGMSGIIGGLVVTGAALSYFMLKNKSTKKKMMKFLHLKHH